MSLIHKYQTGIVAALALVSWFAQAACSKSPAAPTGPTLRISSITPALGSTTGGTSVTVVGTEFGADTTLSIGGAAATQLTVQGTTSITATVPEHAAGTADVVVASGGKTATLASSFTFYAPTGANAPPVVNSVQPVGTRSKQPPNFVNIDDTITLVPTVANAETGVTLSYEWSGPGSFTPTSNGTTNWRVPADLGSTPQTITATLIVTETFAEGAITHRQKSAPFGFAVIAHDSRKEVMDMGEDFLTRFTRQLPVNDVLHNFSPTCDRGDGRAGEAQDTLNNQRDFIEDYSAFRIARRDPFLLQFGSTCFTSDGRPQNNVDACSSFSVHWEGQDKTRGNARFSINGVDYVSAVLENNQWRLCHSSFVGTATFPALHLTQEVRW